MGVRGGNQVAQDVAELLRDPARRDDYDYVVFSRDWHSPDTDNGGHFAPEGTEPDFVNTWPAHCVQGTDGANFHSEISGLYRDTDVSKGMDEPAYSAFEGTTTEGYALTDWLQERGVFEIDVVGIAFDYCVKATAIDAVMAGFDTVVLQDLTAAVDPSNGSANDEMIGAGVGVSA